VSNAPDDQPQPEPVVEPAAADVEAAAAADVEAAAADVEPRAETVVERDEVTVRRAPKFPVFLIMGAALGVVVSLVVTSLFPFDSGEGVAQTYGYIALWGLTLGGAVGCLAAIVAERVTSRGARQVQVERERLELPADGADGTGDDGVRDADGSRREVTDGDVDRD